MVRERKIIVSVATSADGFIARRDGSFDWLERPLTPERELQLNPPGITPTPTLPLTEGVDKGGGRKAILIEKEVA